MFTTDIKGVGDDIMEHFTVSRDHISTLTTPTPAGEIKSLVLMTGCLGIMVVGGE